MAKLNGGKLVVWVLASLVTLGTGGAFGLAFSMNGNNARDIDELEDQVVEGLESILKVIHAHELQLGHVGTTEQIKALHEDVGELKEGQNTMLAELRRRP